MELGSLMKGKLCISTIHQLNIQANLMNMVMYVKLYQCGANESDIAIINYIM